MVEMFRPEFGKLLAKPKKMHLRFGNQRRIDDVSENRESLFFVFFEVIRVFLYSRQALTFSIAPCSR